MNETSFRIECERSRMIITLITRKPSSRMIDSDNREYITSIEVINVADNIISFFFIFKKFIIAHRLTVNDLHEVITFVINSIDYSNDDLTMN